MLSAWLAQIVSNGFESTQAKVSKQSKYVGSFWDNEKEDFQKLEGDKAVPLKKFIFIT